MKKLTMLMALMLAVFALNATIYTVTLKTDDKENPSNGMFRYFVENAANGDTIQFAVDSVYLDTVIRLNYQGITIDGVDGVVLDGGSNGRVFNISADGNSKVYLKHLTIENALGEDYGGGMYAFLSNNALSVENCTFKNNIVYGEFDSQGGGVRTNGGVFTNCFFLNNQVTGSNNIRGGGGVYAVGGKFINCVFAGNTAYYGGGISASATTILNCTFTQNIAQGDNNGGGISAENACEVTNCIVYNNKSNGVENNIESYSSTITYNAVESGNSIVYTSGNIGLSNTPFTHIGNDSLSIIETAPCVDAGNSAASSMPDTDIIGAKRIFGSKVDMGAYEFNKATVISGTAKQEQGTMLSNYTLTAGVVTDAGGNFTITSGQGGFEIGDVINLIPPAGYEFYPKQIIIGEVNQTLSLVAYKGIVVSYSDTVRQAVTWNADTVNVFSDFLIKDADLQISAGTKVKFHGYFGLRFSGSATISARGTYTAPIVFTPADTAGISNSYYWSPKGCWNRIDFSKMSNDADSSFFEFCTIEFSKGYSDFGQTSSALQINNYHNVVVKNCTFTHNTTQPKRGMSLAGGGAMRVVESNINIVNCSFFKNYSYGDGYNIWGGGGALLIDHGNVNVINCTFIENHAVGGNGGAMYVNDSTVNVYNSVFYNNHDHYSNISVAQNYADLNMVNCNVEGGNVFKANVYKNCIDIDPAISDINNGDFSLQANSPCINGGTLDSIADILPDVDIFGQKRIHQDLIDIGVSEFQQDVQLKISGTLRKEYGNMVPGFVLLYGVVTNENGEFSFEPQTLGYNIGDTIEFNKSDEFEIYPSHFIVGWEKQRNFELVAYNGIVIDEFDSFDSNVVWSVDSVNVFTDINITESNLTIEKGTVVRFHTYRGMTISNRGSLTAKGTITDSIEFTIPHSDLADPSTNQLYYCWKGLTFSRDNDYANMSELEFCKIEYVKRETRGGGIYVEYHDKVKLTNCEISNNRGNRGGGIYVDVVDIEIINCVISNNYDSNSGGWMPVLGGGGIYLSRSNSTIIGCLVSNNHSGYAGGGLNMCYSFPLILNCTFANNNTYTGNKGESIYMYESSPEIYNTVMYGDNAFQLEAYVIDTFAQNVEVYNSNVKGGNQLTAKVYKNCIDENPIFSDAAKGDFSIQSNSACRNTGLNELPINADTADVAGNKRIMGHIIDIGAYEFQETSLFAYATDAVVNVPVHFNGEVVLGNATSWSWDFNNDNVSDAFLQTAQHTFVDTGICKVNLTAYITELGRNETITIDVHVYEPIVAGFTTADTSGSVSHYVTFIDTSLNNVQKWHWDFGDGSISTKQNPLHVYETKGLFTVKLIVANDASSDTIIKNQYIEVLDGYLMKEGEYITDSGYFYDDGGCYEKYSPLVYDTLTFYPEAEKNALVFDFQSFEMSWSDELEIYNGTSTSDYRIGTYDGYRSPFTVKAFNPQGALTFVFKSVSDYNWEQGWKARISTDSLYHVKFITDTTGYIEGDSLQYVTTGIYTKSVRGVANKGYEFSHWEALNGDTVSVNYYLTLYDVKSDTTIKAVFNKEQYWINCYSKGQGYVTTSNRWSGLYMEDSDSLLATPYYGYEFVRWETYPEGDSLSVENPLVLKNMYQDTSIQAVFDVAFYDVLFKTFGNGFIDGDTIQNIEHGYDAAEVTAVANEGAYFKHWMDADSTFYSSAATVKLDFLTEDVVFIAVFESKAYAVSFETRGNGFIEGETKQTVLHGNDADMVHAIANEGSHFAYWELVNGDTLTTENPLILNSVVNDIALVAVFKPGEVGVSQGLNHQVNIYPNPAKIQVSIEAPENSIVKLVDLNGQLIHMRTQNNQVEVFEMAHLSNGVYLVHIINESGSTVRKIVKE